MLEPLFLSILERVVEYPNCGTRIINLIVVREKGIIYKKLHERKQNKDDSNLYTGHKLNISRDIVSF